MRKPKHHLSHWSGLFLAAATFFLLSGCARFEVPPADAESRSGTSVVTKDSSDGLGRHEVGSGITLFRWGDKDNPSDRQAPLDEADPEYAEYLEWKRWREFKAYQEWKAQQGAASPES
ncbi:MAG: hypothetical protein OR999_01850 [Arenicellales bacterium]|nr:hypothetical protein [Arenicellales bacterium]